MFKLFRGRRPSASLVISSVALFMSLGGVGYAATQLPSGSVGTRQLRNNSVTWYKIAPGTIGNARINTSLVQQRVTGTCTGNNAVATVGQSGKVTCAATDPKEYGTNAASVPVSTTSTSVISKPLPGGSYLIQANPYITVTTTTAQDTSVTCTLSVPGGATESQTLQVHSGAAGTQEYALPINLASTVPAAGATAGLSCLQAATPATPAPTVSAISTLNAIQTSSNN